MIETEERYLRELRLFLEEVCCTLCRFQHIAQGTAPEDIRIWREAYLGLPGLFAAVRVRTPDTVSYFLEVTYGYSGGETIGLLKHKYGSNAPCVKEATRIILVADVQNHAQWPEIQKQIQANLPSHLNLEVWDEKHLLRLIKEIFDHEVESISRENIHGLKEALDRARGRYAFGEEWTADALQVALVWHFSPWRLKELRERNGLKPRSIIPPGTYRGVVVVADLSSFSSYVRDTRDDEVISYVLTSFYSRAGYEIVNAGGMMYQFIGDEVVGFYGVPGQKPAYVQASLESARALIDIGSSISSEWQQRIDRVQASQGVHIGIALGGIQIVSLRPFGRAHLTAVSDAMNMAARLSDHAGPGEIVVSNTYYQALDEESKTAFSEVEPLEAHNMGKIKAWKWSPHGARQARTRSARSRRLAGGTRGRQFIGPENGK